MAQTWLNADGLYVKFNGSAGTATVAGQYAAEAGRNIVEFTLDLTTLTTTAGTILFDNVLIPQGAWIEKVEVQVKVAATSAGSNATFSLGLTRQDRTTAISNTGLLNAVTVATMNTINALDTSTIVTAGHGGARLGVQLANAGYINGNWGTEAFTAGIVNVKIVYRMEANDNTPGSNS